MINQEKVLLAELAAVLAKGEALTAEQESQLEMLLAKYPEARGIIGNMIEDQRVVLDFNPNETNIEAAWSAFNHKIQGQEEEEPMLRRFAWKKYVSAAAVVLALGIGGAMWWKANQQPGYILERHQFGQKNDVLPGVSFAKLEILGKGTYDLDHSSEKDGSAEGKPSYSNKLKENDLGNDQVHRLQIPKRANYSLRLSDGTRVWLNSESQIEYLAGFTAEERRVKLTGEGYFEVAKDSKRPFIVETNLIEVKAIGTAFSVRSYTEEPKVILTEGKIEVSSGENRLKLQAGHKVELLNSQLKLEKSEGDEEALSIKEGYFNFNDKGIQDILDEVRRWYGVDLVIKRPLGVKKYIGSIDKGVTLGELCVLLKKLTGYDYIIDEDKLIIQ